MPDILDLLVPIQETFAAPAATYLLSSLPLLNAWISYERLKYFSLSIFSTLRFLPFSPHSPILFWKKNHWGNHFTKWAIQF